MGCQKDSGGGAEVEVSRHGSFPAALATKLSVRVMRSQHVGRGGRCWRSASRVDPPAAARPGTPPPPPRVYSIANSHQMMLVWASYDARPESAIPPHLSGKSGDVAATNAQRCYSRWHHEVVRQPFGHDVKRTRCRWPSCKDLLQKVLRRILLA